MTSFQNILFSKSIKFQSQAGIGTDDIKRKISCDEKRCENSRNSLVRLLSKGFKLPRLE